MKRQIPKSVQKARQFAIKAHGDQKYGDRPYFIHLDEVDSVLVGYGYSSEGLRQAAYLHDVLEDCSGLVTAESLRKAKFSEAVVKMVQFCTDEDGPNRKIRKKRTGQRVRSDFLREDCETGLPAWLIDAALLKVADRLANLRACVRTRSTLFGMYLKERDKFRATYQLPNGIGNDLWAEYDQLFDGYSMGDN